MKHHLPAETAYCRRRTDSGAFAIVWAAFKGQPKILRVILEEPLRVPRESAAILLNSKPGSCPEIDEIADQIAAFLGGADISFSLDRVLLELCSDFQQQVLRAEHGIPRGWVSTYQLIAGFIGKPAAARAVGTALATNPFPLVIPCHRAVRSDRTLGGYQGGLAMKRALLAAEGIRFDNLGRVEVKEFFYSPGSCPQLPRRK